MWSIFMLLEQVQLLCHLLWELSLDAVYSCSCSLDSLTAIVAKTIPAAGLLRWVAWVGPVVSPTLKTRAECGSRTQRPTNRSLKREPCRVPRGSGKLTRGLACNRLDQRPRLRRLSHELRAPIMPSAQQFLAVAIYASYIA